MSYWFMYWFTRLDALNSLFVGISIPSIISLIIGSCFYVGISLVGKIENDENLISVGNQIRSLLIYVIMPLLFIGALGSTLIPTTKEAAAIYLVPKIVNNEELQKIPDNFLKLINEKMESYFNDVLEEKSKE